MFYKDSFISNITARCNETAEWDFDSTNLNCFKGYFSFNTKHILKA